MAPLPAHLTPAELGFGAGLFLAGGVCGALLVWGWLQHARQR